MQKHNFSAGPCVLPKEVLQKASEAVLNFNNDNLSLLEISHRSKPFVDVMENARALALELLGLEGKGYKALFLQGGASMQFLMVAQNLLEKRAAYLNTGTWANNAVKEARIFDDILEVRRDNHIFRNNIEEILLKMLITTISQKVTIFLKIMIIFTAPPIIPYLEHK